MSVRPHGAAAATDWIVTHAGHPDIVAAYPNKGNEPDKQWLAIDRNLPTASPFSDRIYAMWVDFTGCCTPHPVVSWATALPDGTHTDWSTPVKLPVGSAMPQGATYLLPHVAPDGTLWTTLTNGGPAHQFASPIGLEIQLGHQVVHRQTVYPTQQALGEVAGLACAIELETPHLHRRRCFRLSFVVR